jgi:hypothetical protein
VDKNQKLPRPITFKGSFLFKKNKTCCIIVRDIERRTMKKFVLLLILIIILLTPVVANAQMFSVPNPLRNITSIQGVIRALIDIAFGAAGLVAVIYLIVGGFRYITSSGNAEAIEGAKATIINAIVGLIVILVAFLLVNYILISLNVNPLYQLGTASPSPGSFGGSSAGNGNGLPVENNPNPYQPNK